MARNGVTEEYSLKGVFRIYPRFRLLSCFSAASGKNGIQEVVSGFGYFQVQYFRLPHSQHDISAAENVLEMDFQSEVSHSHPGVFRQHLAREKWKNRFHM